MIRPVSVTPIALPRIMMLHTLNRFRLISQAALLPGRRARMSEPRPPLRYSDSRSRAPLEPPSRETPLWRTHTSVRVRPVSLGGDCDRAGLARLAEGSQVADLGARGSQGLTGSVVMVAAQPQIHQVRPTGRGRHHDLDPGPGQAAAGPRRDWRHGVTCAAGTPSGPGCSPH